MVRFEYEPRNSFVHNRHPLAAGILITYLTACAAIYWDLRFIAVPWIIIALLSWNAKVPTSWYKALILTWLGYVLGWVIHPTTIITMVKPEFFKVLKPEFTSIVVAELTPEGFPIIGRTAFTYGVLYYLTATIARYPIFMIAGCMMVYTINPSDAVLWLKQMKFPAVFVLIIQAGLRYFSVVSQSMTNIWNAQTLRGMRVTTRNPVKLLAYVSPFLIPLGRQFEWTVNQVAISTSSRAYGASSKFNPFREMRRDPIDNAIIFGLPVLLVIQIYFLVTPPYYLGLI